MQAFQPKNVEYGEVAGAGGTKLNATILFPKDPKRHLEVLWQNEAARSDTSLIVITGQSTWTGPKGLRLGLTLAALEKLNGKPFRLSGFDQPDGSAVLDWQGGALASLPGGCKVGIRLAADRKAAADALAAARRQGIRLERRRDARREADRRRDHPRVLVAAAVAQRAKFSPSSETRRVRTRSSPGLGATSHGAPNAALSPTAGPTMPAGVLPDRGVTTGGTP